MKKYNYKITITRTTFNLLLHYRINPVSSGPPGILFTLKLCYKISPNPILWILKLLSLLIRPIVSLAVTVSLFMNNKSILRWNICLLRDDNRIIQIFFLLLLELRWNQYQSSMKTLLQSYESREIFCPHLLRFSDSKQNQ